MAIIRKYTGYGLTDATVVDATTAGLGDDPFSAVDGTCTIDTSSTPRPPSVAVSKPSGSVARLRYEALGDLNAYAVAFDFDLDTLPPATNSIFQGYQSGFTDAVRVNVTGANQIRVVAGGSQVQTTGTVQAGVRYRCEVIVTAGVEGFAYIYEGDSTMPLIVCGGQHANFGVLDAAWFGQVIVNTDVYTVRYDDMRVADTAEHIGPGADPAQSGPQLVHAWPGIPDGGRFDASFKAASATTASLVVSENADLSTPAATSTAVALVDQVAVCSVTGLADATDYHYGVILDSAPVEHVGTFRTPDSGPLRVLFGSCQQTGSNHVVFNRMAGEGADFLIHCGDLHYQDITDNDPAAFRAAMDASIGTDRYQAFTRNTPWTWTWDNHDFGGTGSWSGSAMAPAAKAVMKQYQPNEQIAAGTWSSDEFWRTWTRDLGGGVTVRFVQLDQRSWRDDPTETPSPDKTMLGAAQKAWLKNLVATDTADLFVIATHGVWYQTGTDRWSTYADEFKELANHIEDNGLTDRCLFIGGDLHAVWFDSGTLISPGLTYELSPQAGGAAFNQGGTPSSLEFSAGHHPNESGRGQYGVLDISQLGGQITVQYRGMQDDGAELIAGTVTYGTADTHSGSATGTHSWTGTAAGHAPAVPDAHGSVTGSYAFSGTATGSTARHGSATGTWSYTAMARGRNGDGPPARDITILAIADPTSAWRIADPTTAWSLMEPEH